MELVTSHFHYTEEYVLDHSPFWLTRKYKQAIREQFNKSYTDTANHFRGLMLLLDQALNQGKGADQILPKSMEEMERQQQEQQEQKEKYVTGAWWKQQA